MKTAGMKKSGHETNRLKKLYELSMTLSGDPMDIFVHVARMIGELLAVRVVCLSEIRGRELYFLSVYIQGKIVVNAGSCPLDITPCATVEESKDIRIYDRVMERFPRATFLADHDAYAYCGFPSLDNDRNVVAVTCLLDDRAREFSTEDQEVLRIVGQRIGLEIARKRLDDERKAALQALQQSEGRFRDIAEAAGEFLWETDPEGHFTYLTERVIETFGYPPEQLVGRAPFDFQPTDDGNWAQDCFLSRLREKRRFSGFEQRVRSRQGDVHWLSVSGTPLWDEQGVVVGFRGSASNITERKRHEEQLERERQHLRNVLDALPVFVAVLKPDGTIVEANQAALEAAHLRRDEVLGTQFADAPAWSHKSEVRAQLLAALERTGEGNRVRYDTRLQLPTGAIAIDFFLCPLGRQGQISELVACGVDISDRKASEEALRNSEERLELALRGANLGLWDWDVQTGGVYFNDQWTTMLGYIREDIQPHYEGWAQLVHPDDMPQVREALDAHLSGEAPFYEVEHRLKTKAGDWKWVFSSGRVFKRDATGAPLRATGIHMDITQRKQLEDRLQAQYEQLCHAQRLTTAGELAATIVHELNQPLSAITNLVGAATLEFAELFDQHPRLRETMGDILRLTDRAVDVARGIRKLVRTHEPAANWIDIGSLIEEILVLTRAQLKQRRVGYTLEVPPTLPRIWGNRVQLQQLFLNLIVNAIDAMSLVDVNRRLLTLRAVAQPGCAVSIAICDTGPGISPKVEGRLFEPFVTDKAEGIGLGLSLCRTIAEAHGGRISVESRARQGTCFAVLLPINGEPVRHDA